MLNKLAESHLDVLVDIVNPNYDALLSDRESGASKAAGLILTLLLLLQD